MVPQRPADGRSLFLRLAILRAGSRCAGGWIIASWRGFQPRRG
ncbi:hypothetical protein AZ78_4156 [Lysobacter capsici AZ78]|uniref:Uncharacterized protein n=1 Tax=Lysobacter capsici AZ78 TaxID=1444315 RepID=A0A108UCX3_9GAMM|nr:hypothetical protein AZ78_4156 [Lysobacter capsici AZ78]